ncbi:MAG: amidase [Sandaracinaceae bacterium]|nr:amidase [Sandaracinaceae bacterium]
MRLAPDAWCRGEWPGFDRELASLLEARGLPSWPAPLPPPRVIDDVFVRLLASHARELARGRAGAVLSALTVGPRLGDRRLHPRSAEVLAKLVVLRLTRARDRERASADARRLARSVAELFAAGFVLVTPTTTFPAPRRGTALRVRGLAAFVKLGNVADATALSVPFGAFRGGLPRGLSLLGPPGSEERLLDIAERLAT